MTDPLAARPAFEWPIIDTLRTLPPRGYLLFLTGMRVTSSAVWALTSLGVPDQLAGGPRPVDEVAAAVGADTDALYRLLRAAAAFGVVTEEPDRRFGLTSLSELLRSDSPQSVRDLVLMSGAETHWRSYGEILYSVRTGKPAFDQVFGAPYFDHIAEHAPDAQAFHGAMKANNARDAAAMVEAGVDLTRFARVADIGGGEGHLLAELLDRHPGVSGVLFDLPAAVAGAPAVLAERGVAERVNVVAGDFFLEVPAADAYVLKLVLHDWADDQAQAVLRTVRTAIGDRAEARVFVMEREMAPPNTPDLTKLLDLDMLVINGGRERSRTEWSALTSAADFTIDTERSARGWLVLELRGA